MSPATFLSSIREVLGLNEPNDLPELWDLIDNMDVLERAVEDVVERIRKHSSAHGPVNKNSPVILNLRLLSAVHRNELLKIVALLLWKTSPGFLKASLEGRAHVVAINEHLPLVTGADKHAVGIYVHVYEILESTESTVLGTGVYVGTSCCLPIRAIQLDTSLHAFIPASWQRPLQQQSENQNICTMWQGGRERVFRVSTFKLLELPQHGGHVSGKLRLIRLRVRRLINLMESVLSSVLGSFGGSPKHWHEGLNINLSIAEGLLDIVPLETRASKSSFLANMLKSQY